MSILIKIKEKRRQLGHDFDENPSQFQNKKEEKNK